jgi:multidrug resistance efflux pump
LIAEESYAKSVHEEEQAIFKQDATTERLYLDAIQKYKAAQAARERGVAQTHKAEQAVAARIGEEHVLVAEVGAQLADAKLNLEWTRVVSPANGYVTNVQLREGSYIHVGVPVLTCIDGDAWWIVANYRENSLENIRPGQRVGLTFNTYPGRVFPGVVQTVGWGVDEGQSAPSGSLPTIQEPKNWIRLAQRFQVRITPQLPDSYPLRVGATATAGVYTQDGHWLNGLTGLWQRIEAALEFLR